MSRFVKLTFNWHKTSTERARDAPRASSCAADTQKQISINTQRSTHTQTHTHAQEQCCHHAQMPIEMTTATTTTM